MPLVTRISDATSPLFTGWARSAGTEAVSCHLRREFGGHLGDEARGRDVTDDGHGPIACLAREPADRRRRTWSETRWEEPGHDECGELVRQDLKITDIEDIHSGRRAGLVEWVAQ